MIDDIVHATSMLDTVSWSFVCRDSNGVTHELARCLPWVIGRKFWLVNFPSHTESVLA